MKSQLAIIPIIILFQSLFFGFGQIIGNTDVKKMVISINQNSDVLKGVNLGNALEAPEEGDWGIILVDRFFQAIKDAGFTCVRVPIRWNAHAETDEPYTIKDSLFKRIDWVVNNSLFHNLVCIINIHHYEELMADPEGHKDRFLSLWQQISNHYQNQSQNLYFELLNEPTNNLTNNLWNQYLDEAVGVIRHTNPTRKIIIGPTNWNNLNQIENLILPQDPNIIATFHYYSPFQFTHQGAEWVEGSNAWMGTKWEGTESEKAQIMADFDTAAEWAKKCNTSLLLGEFGAYSKAEMASRVRWTEFVRQEAENRNISWCYWEFAAGFGIYRKISSSWEKDLLQALLPNSPVLTTTTETTTTTTASTNSGLWATLISSIASSLFYRRKKKKES
ncbi:MAG: glycoside hydrolase family 5 protein [Candidatus Hodarchaeota archaeon]